MRWQRAGAAMALSLLFAQVSAAEPISVISGEHEDFTRLVLELPENTEWQITSETGKSILKLEGFDDGFDLTRAFSIIPRTRLKALVARDSVLELQLGCECPVQSYVEQGRFLVLDISDGLALADTPAAPPRSQEMPSSPFGIGDLLWSRGEPVADIARAAESAMIESDGASEVAVDDKVSERLAETKKQLLQAFSDAASRDIIALDRELDAQVDSDVPEIVEPEIFDSSQAQIILLDPTRSNLRVTSSRDIPQFRTEVTNLDGATCPSADIVDIGSWSDTDNFSDSLANSNSNLFDDAGHLRREEILKRAKMYVYFGFGAEARQTLSLRKDLVSAHPELLDLANILEIGFARNPRLLHRFSDCDSDLALWGILAAKSMPSDMVVNSEAALRALKKLPTHLQFYIAEDLANRLVQLGDTANAQIAVNVFENLEENFQDMSLLVSAKIEPIAEQSHELLSDLSATNHAQTPEAIVQLIDHHVENDILVPAEVALLAEAFATELRESDEGKKALRAFILAAIKSLQFEKAYLALNNPRIERGSDLERELVSAYFAEFTGLSGDAEFLDGIFRRLPPNKDAVNSIVIRDISMRLLDLGFASEAKETVAFAGEDLARREFSLLKARLALHDNDFERAVDHLSELNSPEAEILRGQALQALQRPEEAARAYRNAEQDGLATSAIWLSDQWANYITSDDPQFGAVQEISSTAREEILVGDSMLANTQDQIEASAAAREILETLLQGLQIPE